MRVYYGTLAPSFEKLDPGKPDMKRSTGLSAAMKVIPVIAAAVSAPAYASYTIETSGTFNAIEMHPIGNGGDNWHVVPAPINFYAKVELSTHFAWGNYYGGTLNAFTINGVNATDMFLDTVYVPISNTNPVIQINLGGNSYSPIPHITYLGLYFSVADLAAAPTSLPGNSSFYLSHIDPSSSIRVFPGGGYYTYTGLTNFTFTISGTPPQEGVESIPEPTSWMLMVGGFGLIGGAMRSRHKAAVTFA